uniref:Uncharacterized protein n=1 Tax=Cucumis melo TaxID=3656 RepID=A0A9I9D9Z8_CUCME
MFEECFNWFDGTHTHMYMLIYSLLHIAMELLPPIVFLFGSSMQSRGEAGGTSSPENVRREILELEFPDDGYNYLLYLRAYDASRMIVSKVNFDANENVYEAASKIVGVRIQNVVDLEIAALLDDDDLLRFGSDVTMIYCDLVLM